MDISFLEGFSNRFFVALFIGITAALVSFKYKFLTRSGSIAAGILAVILFSIGSWQWLLPMIIFFLPSSLLSRVSKKKFPEAVNLFEKSGTRDATQVIVNGGIGGALAILWLFNPGDQLYVVYIGSLSAAIADTWGTEIGLMSRGRAYLVTTLKETMAGTSGAVSWPGLLGGFVGTLLIVCSGFYWMSPDNFLWILVVVLSGILAGIVDSLLGTTLQFQYRCNTCGKITERNIHCDTTAQYYRGLRWMNNDMVNLCCNCSGALFAFIASIIFL